MVQTNDDPRFRAKADREAGRGQKSAGADFAERINVAGKALGWFLADSERRERIFMAFYGGDVALVRKVRENGTQADAPQLQCLLGEWALAEAPNPGGQAGQVGIVLRESGLVFSPRERAWLRSLEGSAMSLYVVQQTEPGRLQVLDLVPDPAQGGAGPEWIEEGWSVLQPAPGDVVGLRLVPGGELRRCGAGQFWLLKSFGLRVAAEVGKEARRLARRGEAASFRLAASGLLLRSWLVDRFVTHGDRRRR